MLAVLSRNNGMRRMKSVGGGNPHRFHVRVGAELLNVAVRFAAVALLENFEDSRIGIRGGHQFDSAKAFHRRKNFCRADTHANHADPQLSFGIDVLRAFAHFSP